LIDKDKRQFLIGSTAAALSLFFGCNNDSPYDGYNNNNSSGSNNNNGSSNNNTNNNTNQDQPVIIDPIDDFAGVEGDTIPFSYRVQNADVVRFLTHNYSDTSTESGPLYTANPTFHQPGFYVVTVEGSNNAYQASESAEGVIRGVDSDDLVASIDDLIAPTVLLHDVSFSDWNEYIVPNLNSIGLSAATMGKILTYSSHDKPGIKVHVPHVSDFIFFELDPQNYIGAGSNVYEVLDVGESDREKIKEVLAP